MDSEKKFAPRRSPMLIDDDTLAWEAGQDDVKENPADRKARPDETRAAAEVSIFLEDDLGVDVRRLFIQVRDGHLYVQGSVDSENLRQEILNLLPQRASYKSCEIQLSVQKSD